MRFIFTRSEMYYGKNTTIVYMQIDYALLVKVRDMINVFLTQFIQYIYNRQCLNDVSEFKQW